MMRQSRWQWLSNFFRPEASRGPKVKREKKEPKKKRLWRVYTPGRGFADSFAAHTKSEARALAKKALGFKDRLPVGMLLIEVWR